MTQEQGTPADWWQRIRQEAERAVDKYARSGPLSNSSVSSGGLTIRGGFFRMVDAVSGAFEQFYIGPVGDVLGNGTFQRWWRVKRADGSTALRLWDAFPGSGGELNQALSWMDRNGNVVFADDTDSGQGLARPYLSGGFARARFADMNISTTSGSFETLWKAGVRKQQPRLEVVYMATTDVAGTTGETRILVDGVQVGSTATEGFVITTHFFGPNSIAGAHMQYLNVEIQGRVTGGTGALRVEPIYWQTQQT